MRAKWILSAAGLLASTGLALAQTFDQPPLAGSVQPVPMIGVADAPIVHAEEHAVGGGDGDADPDSRFWGKAEYLLWWIKDSQLTPLVTNGSPADAFPGALGQPGTRVLFGEEVDHGAFSGGRFTAGVWLTDEPTIGVEGSYFFLASRSTSGHFGAGNGLLAIPYFDVLDNGERALVIAAPAFNVGPVDTFSCGGLTIGPGTIVLPGGVLNNAVGTFQRTMSTTAAAVDVSLSSRLQGAEANALLDLSDPCTCFRINAIAGFRWVQLEEKLRIATHSTQRTDLVGTFTGGFAPNGQTEAIPAILDATGTDIETVSTVDQFDTANNFYGGQLGLRGEYIMGPVFIGLVGKVALGNTHQTLTVQGSHVVTESCTLTGVVTRSRQAVLSQFNTQDSTTSQGQGGLFAQRTNSGVFTRDSFSVIPEVSATVGFHVTDNVSATLGYTFLYWSEVVRPGDQIDRGVNLTQAGGGVLAGPERPAVLFKESDFWAQGLTAGLKLEF